MRLEPDAIELINSRYKGYKDPVVMIYNVEVDG